MTIEALKAEISNLCRIRNNRNAIIAKARGVRRAGLIEDQQVTNAQIATLQRQIVAIRRSEVA